MAELASIATVSQLLSNSIAVVKFLQRRRQRVRGAPKVLRDVQKQLDGLLKILELITEEKELLSTNITSQLHAVYLCLDELQVATSGMTTVQKKTFLRQYLHALFAGGSEERGLAGILSRLDAAQNNLSLRIQVAHIGLTGSLHDGFTAALPTIHRIDQSLRKILGSRLEIASQLEPLLSSPKWDGTLLLTEKDLQSLKLQIPAQNNFSIRHNIAAQDATQENALAGLDELQTPTTAEIRGNRVSGKAQQTNFIGGAMSQFCQLRN